MKKLRNVLPMLFVLVVAVVLRFWKLGEVPPSPNWDEAALGYNAYSIRLTGRDEYGTWFPLSLRSYDDFKPPLYMYLTVPSVWLFGLSVWSTRLPAAVFGVLTVLGSYLLTRQLLSHVSEKSMSLGSQKLIAFFSALLLAVSPWHLQFSRAAFEAGLGVFLTVWAVYFFLRSSREAYFRVLSAMLFGLSLYAYHSQRIFTPLLVLLLGVVFRKLLLQTRKMTVLSILAGILVVLPLVPVFTNPQTLTRLRGTSSLADQTRLLASSVEKIEAARVRGDLLGEIMNNRRVVFAQTVLDGYLRHFSLGWLFIRGDNARHHAPSYSLLHLFELPFLLYGLYLIGKIGGRFSRILFGWMLIAPIAASPTTELPHAIRTLVMLPTLQIATGLGLYAAWRRIQPFQVRIRRVMLTGFALMVVFVLGNYVSLYFDHQNREFSEFWQYGYRQAVEVAVREQSNYNKIVVSTKLEQPHMFFLFFLRYDPRVYLSEGGTASGGFAEVKNRFGKYEFRPIDWNKEQRDGSILYIGTPTEIPSTNKGVISYLDGSAAMHIADR